MPTLPSTLLALVSRFAPLFSGRVWRRALVLLGGAKVIDRDAVRSSQSHFVKASGLRWVCVMLLVPISWTDRVWALPFLTALAPFERYDRERGRRHTTLTA